MWHHEVGRIDFERPLFQLVQRGWDFHECSPIAGAEYGVFWAVKAVNGADRVRADGSERNEAWAEAVRLALLPPGERGPRVNACHSSTMRGSPDDPTVCDEERARLKQAGWSFTDHPTAQANGRAGWAVSGSRGARQVRTTDEDRSGAWGAVLILAGLIGTPVSAGPVELPAPDCVG